ncbi:MAG: molybdenum cofactor guanylyltransferase MobA [Proteobacteria bacterium]|nr:molybdenum cofactor guanylyltransferase MobA [Pseudomonadota bacterium]
MDEATIGSVVGVVLAGGLSRRMGGGDKTLLTLGGGTMLERVITAIGPQVAALAINANGDAARFAHFGCDVIADPVPGYPGPLAGVLAGLRWAAAKHPRASHVLSVPGDAPFLPATLVERLRAGLLLTTKPIVMAASGGRAHPVAALWPVALAEDLEAAIRAGARKVETWAEAQGAMRVEFPMIDISGALVDPFFNANSPADLDKASRILTGLGER